MRFRFLQQRQQVRRLAPVGSSRPDALASADRFERRACGAGERCRVRGGRRRVGCERNSLHHDVRLDGVEHRFGRRLSGDALLVGESGEHDARRPVVGDERTHCVGPSACGRGRRVEENRCVVERCGELVCGVDVSLVPAVGHHERHRVGAHANGLVQHDASGCGSSLDARRPVEVLHDGPPEGRTHGCGQLLHHRRRHCCGAAHDHHVVRGVGGNERCELFGHAVGAQTRGGRVAGMPGQFQGHGCVGRAVAVRQGQRQVGPAAHKVRRPFLRCSRRGQHDGTQQNRERHGCCSPRPPARPPTWHRVTTRMYMRHLHRGEMLSLGRSGTESLPALSEAATRPR